MPSAVKTKARKTAVATPKKPRTARKTAKKARKVA
jgi:hypothetical protein